MSDFRIKKFSILSLKSEKKLSKNKEEKISFNFQGGKKFK